MFRKRAFIPTWIVAWSLVCVPAITAADRAIDAVGPFAADDWPWWRGPQRDGIAFAEQDPPLEWTDTENVRWKTPIPGRGHGSPTLVGERIFLATADEARDTRSVLCLHRETGALLWERVVHTGRPTPPRNKKGTQASSTVACDGERLFISFLHDGAMVTSALSLGGELLWQTPVSQYVVHQGYGSSPAIYGPLVIVTADNKAGGAVAGIARATGEIVWKRERPSTPNYSSPVIHDVAGRTQLILTGCDLVTSLDPLTGSTLWEMTGATTECVTTTPTNGRLIYTSGGYPRNHVSAVQADGSGTVAWENGTRVYVPSLLVQDGSLFAVTDAGVAMCWNSDTGEELWKGRLGGTFSSSPVIVGDRIYATNEEGETYVFSASPAGFQLLRQSKLGGECFATAVICGGSIYLRVAETENEQRQEFLYRIARNPQ